MTRCCGRRRHGGRLGRRWWRGTLLVVLLGLASVAPSPAGAQRDAGVELRTVEAVRFEGRRHVPAKALRSVLKTRGRGIWPWSEAPLLRLDFVRADSAAIEAVCQQHGFLDARVALRLERGGRRESEVVTFVVSEGLRYRIARVDLQGLEGVPETQVRRRLYARPGRAFNPLYLVADTARIAAEHRERGYLPQVTARAARDRTTVRIVYEITRGPLYHFGEVALTTAGRSRVKPRIVLREFAFRPGEVYRASRVEESVEGVYATGLFSQVQVTPRPDAAKAEVGFDVRVRERAPRWLDAGIGSGTAERLRATAEWGHRNVDARGRQAMLSSVVAFDGQAKFLLARVVGTLYDPWLFRSRRRGLVSPYYESRHDRADPRWVVRQESKGFSFTMRREYRNFTRLILTQDNSFVWQRVDLTEANLPDTVRDSLTRNVTPSYSTHRMLVTVDRDSRDNLLDPSRGSRHAVTAEIAGGPLRGTSSFTKLHGYTARYWPLRRGWVLATHFRAGAIDPFGNPPAFSAEGIDASVARVPLEDRFRIGGVNSVRGYNENEILLSGGLAMVQGNVELRVPVAGPFGIEMFVDAGNVWARPAYAKLGDLLPRVSGEAYSPGDVRYVCGVGARLNLPVGPLRFDVSWNARPAPGGDRRPRAQFAIGPSF